MAVVLARRVLRQSMANVMHTRMGARSRPLEAVAHVGDEAQNLGRDRGCRSGDASRCRNPDGYLQHPVADLCLDRDATGTS